MSERELSPKQLAYVEGRAQGKNKRQAALDAGYAPYVANCAGSLIENKKVKMALKDLVKDIPDELLVEKLYEGLEAMKQVVIGTGMGTSGVEEYVDHKERREHIKLIAQLKGEFVEKTQSEVSAKLSVERQLSDAELERQYREELERSAPVGEIAAASEVEGAEIKSGDDSPAEPEDLPGQSS